MKVGQNASPPKDGTLAGDSNKVPRGEMKDLTQREWAFAISLSPVGYTHYLDARQQGISFTTAQLKALSMRYGRGRRYAEDRHESDCCQVGTQGCAINHSRDNGDCATW